MPVVKLNRSILRKAALAVGLAVLIEACIVPSVERNWHFGVPESAVVNYMSGVLRENRTGLGPLEEVKLAQVILAESVRHEMDPLFVLALIKTESTFYNWSRSFTGALGLMQIRPETGEELASQLKLEWNGAGTLLDPYLNVKMGVHYLSRLNKRYNDPEISLAAYNVGPGRLDSSMREDRPVGRNYVNKVMNNYKDLKERADYYSYGG